MTNPILSNRYEIQQQMGQKADRRTLLARNLQTQSLVVIKLLSFEQDMERDELKLFERQIETLKTLSHPGIPAYIDHFEVNLRRGKGLALVEAYIPGRSLESYLQSGQMLNEAEVRQLAQGLLTILIYLHSQNPPVIHRDIKPSNILLADRPQENSSSIYLIDFGSVQNYASRDQNSFTVVGTYGYMPPEQFGGRTVVSSDLYSLGMTLIALLTGTHPSSMPQPDYLAQLERNRTLSIDLYNWLKWLTAMDLSRRPTSAQQALQGLQKGLQQPVPIQKPVQSKITLEQGTDYIEIQIPSRMGQTKLRIDSKQVVLTNQILGMRLNRSQVGDRRHISRVEYGRSNPAETTESRPHLILWVAGQAYELGQDQSMSSTEAEWLAYALSNWLQLPLTIN
ncbi:hypothetical protein BST81_21775 [Leptolyngbya sp. 'hensonii']|nr:hypothetical protein BST81_21775 [Leptolyngbya sp. 'hensonii']